MSAFAYAACVMDNSNKTIGGVGPVPRSDSSDRAGRAKLGNQSTRKDPVRVPSRGFLTPTLIGHQHAKELYAYRAQLLEKEITLSPDEIELQQYVDELRELQRTLKDFGKSVVVEKMVKQAKQFGWVVRSGSSSSSHSSVAQPASFADILSSYVSSMLEVTLTENKKNDLVREAFVMLYGIYRAGQNGWLKEACRDWLREHKLELQSELEGKKVSWVYAGLVKSKDDFVKTFRKRCMRTGIAFPMETRPRSDMLMGNGTGWKVVVSVFGYNMDGYTAIKEEREQTESTDKVLMAMMVQQMKQMSDVMKHVGISVVGSNVAAVAGNNTEETSEGTEATGLYRDLASPDLTRGSTWSDLNQNNVTNPLPLYINKGQAIGNGGQSLEVGLSAASKGELGESRVDLTEDKENIVSEADGGHWNNSESPNTVCVPGVEAVGTASTALDSIAAGVCHGEAVESIKPASSKFERLKQRYRERRRLERLAIGDQKTGSNAVDSDSDVISDPEIMTCLQGNQMARADVVSVEKVTGKENNNEVDVRPGKDNIANNDEEGIGTMEVSGDKQVETLVKVKARKSVKGSTSVWENRRGKRDGERLQVGVNNAVYGCCIALSGDSCDYALCQECRLELLGGVGRSKRAKRGDVDGKTKVKQMWKDNILKDCSDAHEVKMLDPRYDGSYFAKEYLEANKGKRPAACACCCVEFTNEKV